MYLAMIPDVHNLKKYPFRLIHKKMEKLSSELGFVFIDLLPSLEGLKSEQVWVMNGDPHPGAMAHARMAKQIVENLRLTPHKETAQNY